jgi:hypothetical protein
MAEEYKLSRKEVLEEMVSLAKEGIKEKWSSFKQAVKDGTGFSGSYFNVLCHLSYLPYAIPLFARNYREAHSSSSETSLDEMSPEEKLGGTLGILSAGLIHGFAIREVCVSKEPSLLLIPLATNIISGAYEIGKPLYQKAKERVSTRRAEQELTAEKPAEKPVEETKKPKEYM